MGAITRRLAKLEAKRAKATPAEYRVIYDDDRDAPTEEECDAMTAEAKREGRRVIWYRVVYRDDDGTPAPKREGEYRL